ncbi:MAG TPA: glycosyltransferase family 4 protein [Acidimicrobiales bacterium]|nr:glycosyltransferase family 4 protein [Acidimicrobiales bacterium]
MRLLCITNLFPMPEVTGTHVRVLGLLRSLAAVHAVHLLCRGDDTAGSYLAALRDELRGAEVEEFDPGPPAAGTPAAMVGRWSAAMWRGMPTWIAAQHHDGLLERAVSLAPGFDAVVILDDYAGSYVPRLRQVPGVGAIVADKGNVMGASLLEPDPEAGFRGRVRTRIDRHLVRRHERRYVGLVDGVVVTSSVEGARLHDLYGRRPDAVVPSAVTLFDVPEATPTGPPGVLYVGNLEYGPNIEGLIRFVEAAWPPLAERGAELLVAGVASPSQRGALARHAGVRLLGFVDDLAPLCAAATVAVAPVWRGAGVKVKTLTLLGAGLPLVATPVAMEGIAADHDRHALVAGTPAGLAAAIGDLLDDHDRRARLGAAGRALVAERYTWASVGPAFVEAVEQVRGRHPAPGTDAAG